MAQLAAILNEKASNPPYFVAYQLTTTDANGAIASAAPLKVVATDDPLHPYLGVFHNQINKIHFATYLGYSADLKVWHALGEIHESGSQPDIRILPDDSIVYAEEFNPANRPHIRVQYYGNAGLTGLQALIGNPALAPSREITLPGTELAKADGTPEFGRIGYGGDISSAQIEITHHYFSRGRRDLQAIGNLTGFADWSDSPDTATDDLVSRAGGNGKIGDREIFEVGSQIYEIVEAQVDPASPKDFSSWRLFLINKTTNAIEQLNPVLTGGARSLGNPTVSFVRLPAGAPALVFTCFVFSEKHGATPPGGHMFVYPLE